MSFLWTADNLGFSHLGTRILMIGTLTGLQWWIYDSFKTAMGMGTTGGAAQKVYQSGCSNSKLIFFSSLQKNSEINFLRVFFFFFQNRLNLFMSLNGINLNEQKKV